MAKITKFPGTKIINMLKHTLDYYQYMAQPCVRRWPRSPGHIRTPAVMAQWAAFAYVAKQWSLLSPEMQALWYSMASGTILTGKDLFTRSYISGAFTYPTGPG